MCASAVALTSATRAPVRAAVSAAKRPAAPAPTTTISASMRSRGIGGYRTGTVAPVLFRHPSSHYHETGAHPERVERIEAIEAALEPRDWLGWDVRESPAVKRAVLEAVHPGSYVQRIESISLRGGGHLDMDTVLSTGSWECALHSTGGAVAMVDALLGGEARFGASSTGRPAITPSRRGGWASACSTTSRSRPGTRSTRTAPGGS